MDRRRRNWRRAYCAALATAFVWPAAAAAEPAVTQFTGGVTAGFSAGGGPSGIAAGPDGNLWFTQFNSPGRVARITPAGVVTQFTGGVTPGFSANSIPARIAAGPDGNLWFTERADPGRVARITPAGVVTEFTGGVTPGFSANGGPFTIAAGPDGNLWFTQVLDPGRVARITPAGVVTQFTGGMPGFSADSQPAGIVAGPDGNLWFTQQANPGRVARITPAGVVTQFTGGVTPGFSANGAPISIAAGPDGNLWFTQLNNPGRVGRITPAGVVTEFTGGVTPGFSANSRPGVITAGADGNLWFTEETNPGRVARITPNGVVTEFTGGLTPGFTANSRPIGITAGPDGNMWFAQFNDPGRVAMLALDGGLPPPPPPADQRRPTGTSVLCNRGPNPGDDSICTATVGDAGPPPSGSRPSGTVHFTANSRGSFRSGADCTLQPASTSPTVSSCSVTYIPGDANFPDVTAEYLGDGAFLGSKGRSFVVTGGVFGLPAGTPLNIDTCTKMASKAPLGKPARPARSPNAHAAIRAAQEAAASGRELSPGDSKRWCNLELAGSYIVQGGEYVVGTAVFTTGLVMAGTGATLMGAPEPAVTKAAGVGLMAGGTALSLYMVDSLWTQESAQVRVRADPPDPRFRTVARPAKVRRIVVRPGAGLGRADAARLTKLLAAQARASALAKAFAATLDKVGGARKAKNRKYEGIQTRAAVGYARESSRLLTNIVAQSGPASRVLRKFRAFNRRPSETAVKRFRTLASTGKLPKKLKAFFAAVGFDQREIKRLAADAKFSSDAGLPPTLAEAIGGKKALELHRVAAASLRLYINLDEVIAASKLK